MSTLSHTHISFLVDANRNCANLSLLRLAGDGAEPWFKHSSVYNHRHRNGAVHFVDVSNSNKSRFGECIHRSGRVFLWYWRATGVCGQHHCWLSRNLQIDINHPILCGWEQALTVRPKRKLQRSTCQHFLSLNDLILPCHGRQTSSQLWYIVQVVIIWVTHHIHTRNSGQTRYYTKKAKK